MENAKSSKKEIIIVLAEDDGGHAGLIIKNLRRAGVTNRIRHFEDGKKTLDFLMRKENPPIDKRVSYVLLLDLRMPETNGIEVMRKVRQNDGLRGMPIIVVSTTNDSEEIKHCYSLGCRKYIVKPVGYEKFTATMRHLGHYLIDEVIPEIYLNQNNSPM